MQGRQRFQEHLGKGAYLGLAAERGLWAEDFGTVLIFAAASILPALVGVVLRLVCSREHRRSLRRAFIPRLILGLIDQNHFVYAAVLLGASTASLTMTSRPAIVLTFATSGAAFGGAVYLLHRIRRRAVRRWLSIAGIASGVGVIVGLSSAGFLPSLSSPSATGLSLVLSAGAFYVLAFVGQSEESEFDIAIVCLGLSLALASIELPRTVRSMALLLPLAVFVVYCERIRKHLVVFKHVIRGMEHERCGRLPMALASYRMALQRDAKSELAASGVWRVHQGIDLARLDADSPLMEMIDPAMCLERARSLIPKANEPRVRAEALKLLDIAQCRNPAIRFQAEQARLDVALAAGDVDDARAMAVRMARDTPPELAILADEEVAALLGIWSRLMQSPALIGAGSPLIEEGGMLLAFLATLEERRRREPEDATVAEFRPFLYRKLRLADVDRAIASDHRHVAHVDPRYVRQVARESAGEPGATSRAIELLQVAERLSPSDRLGIWAEIGRLCADADPAAAKAWFDRVFDDASGRERSSLSESDQEALYEAARLLAQEAQRRGDADRAIECWEVYSQSPKSGVPTRRLLADLYEERGDLIGTLRHVQAALAFALPEKELRFWRGWRERLYAELSPETVQGRAKEAASVVDVAYCLRTATRLYEKKAAADEILHYVDLVSSVTTDRLLDVNFLLGRLYLREGRIEDAAACFEAVCGRRPERFRDADQEKAWFRACRTLGELLVERLNRPREAIGYLSVFKDHIDSGADTLFLLAKAHEQVGQTAHARKWYDMVLVYPSHPRACAAREALARLGQKS